MMQEDSVWRLFTDGGSRGNPGPGACSYVLYGAAGNLQEKCGKYLGICTNNQAEYQGILTGLQAAKRLAVANLDCFLDSELVVKQVNGEYRIKNPDLKMVFDEVARVSRSFKHVSFTHIPRGKNSEADALVNETLDSVL